MAATPHPLVTEYIAKQPASVRPVLRQVRRIIQKTAPNAEETISYQIPAYKLGGAVMIYFAAWKAHYSLYPATGGLIEALGKALTGYEVSKGTIRFPFDQPLPVKLIERIVRFRAKDAGGRLAAKLARRRAKSASPQKVASKRAAAAAAPRKKAAPKKVAPKQRGRKKAGRS